EVSRGAARHVEPAVALLLAEREAERIGVAPGLLGEKGQPAPVLEPPDVLRPRAAEPPCVRGVDEEASERGAHPIEDEALEALAGEGFELVRPNRERRRRGLRGREVAERTALPVAEHIRKGPEHHAQRLALLREPGDLGTGRERLRERGEIEVPGAGAAHTLEL